MTHQQSTTHQHLCTCTQTQTYSPDSLFCRHLPNTSWAKGKSGNMKRAFYPLQHRVSMIYKSLSISITRGNLFCHHESKRQS